ncbi:MAG TPA: alpha/beta hydrolase [Candidatus Ligilactobacillus excrementipullorum]|nr:alpha/beta hydrolase [Candidatus Ligilactobacillus excrementipullorum]
MLGLFFTGALIWAGHMYQQRHEETSHYQKTATPTIMMHGWSSSLHAEEPLIKTAVAKRIATEAMVIHVTPEGQLKVEGKLTGRKNNPLILVQFDNNRVGEIRYAQGLLRIVKYLQKKYGMKKFNVVGHSMGAYAWVYYAAHWGSSPQLPQLNKMVLLAGPYDGIMNKGHANQPLTGKLAGLWDDAAHANKLAKNGRPKIIHPEYERLLKHRAQFPRQVHILNIYGDLEDGSDSDGLVTLPSVRSLRYLVADRVSSYEEYRISRNMGQHSRLHIDNPQVSEKLMNYLWRK